MVEKAWGHHHMLNDSSTYRYFQTDEHVCLTAFFFSFFPVNVYLNSLLTQAFTLHCWMRLLINSRTVSLFQLARKNQKNAWLVTVISFLSYCWLFFTSLCKNHSCAQHLGKDVWEELKFACFGNCCFFLEAHKLWGLKHWLFSFNQWTVFWEQPPSLWNMQVLLQ